MLLSTTREDMISKVMIIKSFCSYHGMLINASKTKFFVIGGSQKEAEPLCLKELLMSSCTSYMYLLASPFANDGGLGGIVG